MVSDSSILWKLTYNGKHLFWELGLHPSSWNKRTFNMCLGLQCFLMHQSFVTTVKSCQLEVLDIRGFILKSRKFEL